MADKQCIKYSIDKQKQNSMQTIESVCWEQ